MSTTFFVWRTKKRTMRHKVSQIGNPNLRL
jgi:hypothetical protein